MALLMLVSFVISQDAEAAKADAPSEPQSDTKKEGESELVNPKKDKEESENEGFAKFDEEFQKHRFFDKANPIKRLW